MIFLPKRKSAAFESFQGKSGTQSSPANQLQSFPRSQQTEAVHELSSVNESQTFFGFKLQRCSLQPCQLRPRRHTIARLGNQVPFAHENQSQM